MTSSLSYADDCATCLETHSTLRIYPASGDADLVTALLAIAPTKTQIKSATPYRRKPAWFRSSKGLLDSRDTRRHIDWILDRIEPATVALNNLRCAGAKIDIFSYWVSRSGDGGPMLSPSQLKRLAAMEIEIGWDVYFAGREKIQPKA